MKNVNEWKSTGIAVLVLLVLVLIGSTASCSVFPNAHANAREVAPTVPRGGQVECALNEIRSVT